MDMVGSEIGQKMRSAIKAKLTELGCYVDDELPDYVMVMVANKRTREQMEDDLQLFLGDNTELFVNWLHQVLKKLQEVTVATPMKASEIDKGKEKSLKDKKSKEKKLKEKIKKSDLKKAKRKDKEKIHHKKEEKKSHKNKKKSKDHEMIRPNIPPLLMNMEKDSEPSITDIFAGQILKNHGITLDEPIDEPKLVEKKPIIAEVKRPAIPIIDPATISSQPEATIVDVNKTSIESNISSLSTTVPGEEELNQIEAQIEGLKKKLAGQLETMSDDEDFLNIRTEADELMTDFAEDVLQELSQPPPSIVSTPLTESLETPTPLDAIPKPLQPEIPKEPTKEPIENLLQIELKLPKRPIRERLGLREELKKIQEVKEKKSSEKRTESPERFTPERDPDFKLLKSAKSRHGDHSEPKKRISVAEDSDDDKSDTGPKRLTSKVSVLENRPTRSTCASVVRVRPRPRVGAPASSLLLKAVADAHKSLLNKPPKINSDTQKLQRALVLPMRRCVEAQKIVIQVPGGDSTQDGGDSISLEVDSEDDKSSKKLSDCNEEYGPGTITKKIINDEYVPKWWNENRSTSLRDDKLIIETKNIHNLTVGKDKSTQFIVTMDGYHPNAFLAKKLQTEGLLNDDDELAKTIKKPTIETKENPSEETEEVTKEKSPEKSPKEPTSQKKRLSDTSEESNTQVILKHDNEEPVDTRRTTKVEELKDEPPVVKKRRGSPIVFDVAKKEKLVHRERQRTESGESDNPVTVVTTTNTHKYDTVPPLSSAERKLMWCRAFPMCRYGSSCVFAHPRCKFAASCTRRNCVYSHAHAHAHAAPTPKEVLAAPAVPPLPAISAPVAPSVASHVVPAANYKSISAVSVPNMCKYYPSCVNPACHFYHPKPCRYGKSCVNKLECNFYHADMPAKW